MLWNDLWKNQRDLPDWTEDHCSRQNSSIKPQWQGPLQHNLNEDFGQNLQKIPQSDVILHIGQKLRATSLGQKRVPISLESTTLSVKNLLNKANLKIELIGWYWVLKDPKENSPRKNKFCLKCLQWRQIQLHYARVGDQVNRERRSRIREKEERRVEAEQG